MSFTFTECSTIEALYQTKLKVVNIDLEQWLSRFSSQDIGNEFHLIECPTIEALCQTKLSVDLGMSLVEQWLAGLFQGTLLVSLILSAPLLRLCAKLS